MTPFMSALGWFATIFIRLAAFLKRAHTAPTPQPRYCQLFIEFVALFIYIRKQQDVTDDQKALTRTLIGAAQRILTTDEWYTVLSKANMLLTGKPEIVSHWSDARDALDTRLRDVD